MLPLQAMTQNNFSASFDFSNKVLNNNTLLEWILSQGSESFGEILLSVLKVLDLNQKKLAELLQVSSSSVNTWIKKSSDPRASSVISVEKVLNPIFEEKFNYKFRFIQDVEYQYQWCIQLISRKDQEFRKWKHVKRENIRNIVQDTEYITETLTELYHYFFFLNLVVSNLYEDEELKKRCMDLSIQVSKLITMFKKLEMEPMDVPESLLEGIVETGPNDV